MSMMFDTPDGVAFVRACARKGALELEMQGLKRSGDRRTAYSIIKEVYGFRGSRQSVLEDLNEYIEAELRLRKLGEEQGKEIVRLSQIIIDQLTDDEMLSQPNFEDGIAYMERNGRITPEQRQAMSDLFYCTIVKQNAGNR